MSAPDQTTMSSNVATTARAIDFVSRFQTQWEGLRTVLGVSRLIEKVSGTTLKVKKAGIVLQSGAVGEGELIPYSQASVTEQDLGQIVLNKYRKGVTIEAIDTHGYVDACARTDEAFINTLQNNIMSAFYTFLQSGTLTAVETSFQKALAMAKGYVVNKWKGMNLTMTEVIGFVNCLDAYDYLGNSSISIQNRFGLEYIENFLGYSVVVLVDSTKLPRGKVIATPMDNVVNYYINPANSDFNRAGFNFRTVGVTPMIGSFINANMERDISENNVLMGIKLFAEYIDGIAVVTIDNGTTMGSATITSAAGTDEGTKISITAPSTLKADYKYYLGAASTAPSAPAYLGAVPSGFTEINPVNGVCDNLTGYTAGHKAVLLITNAVGQTIFASAAAGVSIVNKS